MSTLTSFSLPTEFHKHFVIAGFVNRNTMNSLSYRVAKARVEYSSFGFLEWAERFIPDFMRINKTADIRLMTDEELYEFMPAAGPHATFKVL